MKIIVVVASIAGGCGPGIRRVDAQQAGRNALVDAAENPAALERLLAGAVVNGGLWFDNAQCAQQFGRPGEIKPAAFPAFAKCLATLHLKASMREDALGDVVVMQYAPGFEIEARVVPELQGPHLVWIGFESRRDDRDNSPTITSAALESLRASGDANGPLDPVVAKTLELDPTPKIHAALAWLKLCIDDTGAVTEAHVHETTSINASKAFTDIARTWKFRPFTIQDQPVPACAMVRMTYPPGQGPTPETLPLPPPPAHTQREPIVFVEGAAHTLLEGKRIAGSKVIVPDNDTKSAIAESHVHRITGSFRVCIDETGHVESILPYRSTGFATYDRELLAGMHAWVYSPYMIDGEPVAVCTSVTFIYTQR